MGGAQGAFLAPEFALQPLGLMRRAHLNRLLTGFDGSQVAHLIDDRTLARIFRVAEEHRAILLAVSGGPDSMALMYLVKRWLIAGSRMAPAVWVATVDHRLRPESAMEAAFVAHHAKELGFSHMTLVWEAAKPGPGLQARARKARYDLMATYCVSNGISAMITAHTEDDRAETLLMRLRRGSGLDGLAAISEVGSWNGVAVIRPLLSLSKARLAAFLRAGAIPSIHDPSNADPAFERVRIRHAMRALRGAGLGAKALARSAARLARSRAALDTLTDEFLSEHLRVAPLGQGSLDRDALLNLPADLQLRVLARALALIAGKTEAPRMAKLEALIGNLLLEGARTVFAGCRIAVAGNRLNLCRELGRIAGANVAPQQGNEFLWDGRFLLRYEGEGQDVRVAPLGRAGWHKLAARSREDPRLSAALAAMRGDLPAAVATPSLWRAGKLVSAPLVYFAATAEYTDARLLHARLAPALHRFLREV
jgi:tRNA(Ile)-lysidine synthase